MVKVTGIDKKSKLNKSVLPGDMLVSINGNEINDVLDYRFYITEKIIKCVFLRNGTEFEVSVKKGEYDDIGLEFETYLMDKKRTCRNKCIFCFIDQNPKGMREGIYFKDDDERLSFLQGSYITLTNLSDNDIQRIIKMKISPINVSVHTMEPELRCMMTGNRFAGDALKKLKALNDGGTQLNIQLVLCRNINDGDHLIYSVNELSKLKNIVSVSCVPAGLTKHREGLYPIEPYNKESAKAVIDIVEKFGVFGNERKVFCGDEFYLLAGIETPESDYYMGFPQYDNGVGMISDMRESFREALKSADYSADGRIDVATGYAAYGLISSLASKFTEKFPNRKICVHRIKNDFYGESVTVSGLLTGQDYVKQLKGKTSNVLLISRSSLNAEGAAFLDDMTPKELEEKLNCRLVTIECDGYALLDAFAADYTEN